MTEATRPTKALVPAELQGLRPAGAYTFDELYRLGQICHASGLFEDITDAAQAMIKILKGQELGFPPTTAMTAFDIIHKRLFIKPWAIAAKINSCGYGYFVVVEQTAERCTIVFSRKYPGKGWVECPPVSYTYAEAQAHGLVNRSPHWKASPAHMLYQRALGRGGAMYFAELLAGVDAPPDDTPIPPERHAANVVDLFGDTPAVQARLTTERQGLVGDAPMAFPVADSGVTQLRAEIDAILTAQGVAEEKRAAFWATQEGLLSPGHLTSLKEKLTAAAARKPQAATVQEAAQEAQDATPEAQPTPDTAETPKPTPGHSGGKQGVSRARTSRAWQVLRDREDDARVPAALRAEATALLENTAAREEEAYRVAAAIDDFLDDIARPPAQGELV